MHWFTYFSPSRPVRAPGCKSGPAPFPGQISYKATKPGLAVCHILARFYYYGHCHIIGLKSVLWGCKNGPDPFPGRMSYKTTKPGLAVCHILACFLLCCCLLGPLVCFVSFHYMRSAFWLF